MLSLLIYILLCKFYLWTKELSLTRRQLKAFQREDPFFDLLKNSRNDFLASENMIMMMGTVQIANFIFTLYGVVVYEARNINADWKNLLIYRRFVVDMIFFFVQMVIVWKGTNPNKLFSKKNMAVMLLLIACEIILGTVTFIQLDFDIILENWTQNITELNILFLYLMGIICILYTCTRYLFYGLFNFQLQIEGQK